MTVIFVKSSVIKLKCSQNVFKILPQNAFANRMLFMDTLTICTAVLYSLAL